MKLRSILLICILVSVAFLSMPTNTVMAPDPVKVTSGIDIGEKDWSLFWQLFKTYSYWDLEWFDGENWQSKKSSLTVQREYLQPNDCKLTLIFDAPEQGNYRLTFALDKMVKGYAERESKYQWILEYDRFKLLFDWSDIMEIPGIQASKGVKDGYFWFRIRRDNVPQGYHIEIDPHLIVEGERWSSQTVRISNSTYFVLIEMNAPVSGQHDLWRSLDAGETWENMGCMTETFGSNESISQAMLVADTLDSSVIHMTWGSYSASHFLQYTRFDNDTGLFSHNVPVIEQRGWLHWLEIDSNNVLHIVWEDMTTDDGVTVHLRHRSSSDGGLTWDGITLLDSNSWGDWYVNHQLLVTRNDVLNVKWRENDPGAKNHRYMYLRRFTNNTWTSPLDVAGSWDSTYPAGGSDWSSDSSDMLLYTFHNGSGAFDPKTGADIYVSYTNQPTNYSEGLGWIEPICIDSGKVYLQDPSVQLDEEGGAHILAQEWLEGWVDEEFPNPSVGNRSLHYIHCEGYPWNDWWAPVKLNSWHSWVGFAFTRGSAYPEINRVSNRETFDFVFLVYQGVAGEYDIYYQLISLIGNLQGSITNFEGCGAWLFAEERYYNFMNNITLLDTHLDTMQIRFTDEGGNVLHWLFKNSTVDYVEIVQGSDFMRLRDIESGDIQWNNPVLTINTQVYLTNKIMDTSNVDLWMKANTTTGEEVDWVIVQIDYFNIYSIGGFSFSTNSTGDAGRIEGGDVFDLYATNGSWVETDVVYRDLQHIKMTPSMYFGDMSATPPPFGLTYRFDYCGADDEGWITGFGVQIYPVFGIIGSGAEAGRYQTYNVTLFNRGEKITSMNVSAYMRYDQTTYGGTGNSKFFIDLWFNKINASSTVGVRVNAYEYPMIDRSSPWISWLVGTEWVPYEGLRKDAMLFSTLLNADNTTLYVPEIKLVRVYMKLEQQYPEIPFRTEVRDYGIWDLTFDQVDPFTGVQTPQMDDTKVPFVYGGGLLGSLWSALQGLWVGIFSPALLVFWDVFVGFLDTIAGALGAPHFFTNLFTWIGESLGFMTTGAEYLMTVMTSIFTLIGSLLGAFLTTMGDLISNFVTTITMFTDMMAGGWGVGANLWETFNIGMWLQVAMIFYPLYLIILWEEKGMDAVISQLTMMFGILSWLFTFFIAVITFTVNLITSFIEAIPIAE